MKKYALTREILLQMQADKKAGIKGKEMAKKYSVPIHVVWNLKKHLAHLPKPIHGRGRLTTIAEGAQGQIIAVSQQPAPAPVNGARNAAAPAENGGVLCGVGGCTVVSKNVKGRAIHRVQAHGIPGKSAKYRLNYLAKKTRHNGELQHADSHSFISPNRNTTPEENYHLSRAFGRVQGYLQDYAGSLDVPAATFAYRVGELLQSEARGMLVGTPLPVPSVRRAASRRV